MSMATWGSPDGFTVPVARRYLVAEAQLRSADDTGYQAELDRALADATSGEFTVLIVGSLGQLARNARDAVRLLREFRSRGCTIRSVQEPWLNGSAEVTDALTGFAEWTTARHSEKISAAMARKRAEDPGFSPHRPPGSADKATRRRDGYVAAWAPGGSRRNAQETR